MAEARAEGTSELFAPNRPRLRETLLSIKWFARHKPVAFAGGVIVLILAYLAILPQTVAPYDPRELAGERFENPSSEFILGTDDLGRDVFSRSIWAGLIPTTLSHSTHRLRSSSEVTFETAMLTPIRAFTGLRPSSSAIRLGASDVR